MTSVPTNKAILKPLVLTTGEPAGIGMDILLQLAIDGTLNKLKRPVLVLADATALEQRYQRIYGSTTQYAENSSLWQVVAQADSLLDKINSHKHHDYECDKKPLIELDKIVALNRSNLDKDNQQTVRFYVINTPCEDEVTAGQLSLKNARMVYTQLLLAHELANAHESCAIVTAPLQKSVLIDAGITLPDNTMFTGHTEFFMQLSGCTKVVMMLANSKMRVALVTTHLPLKQVADAITQTNVRQTVEIVLEDMQQKFGLAHPKILVCGLNPHAGEDGHLGMEEIEIINPVLQEFIDQGVNISLAMPADTLFTQRHLEDCDAVIAMYHDQGLPVLKSHGFGDTVNLTLGLPYIRTSVDHGTALDLAGSGQASSSSLWQALSMADDMANASH